MKLAFKFYTFTLALVLALSITGKASADSPWQFSLDASRGNGLFDYILHYDTSDFSQVISKVNMPQDQNLPILSGKYYFSDSHFIQFQYGNLSFHTKGRGSDSDWTVAGSDELTYYGDMDFYGNQRIFSMDIGTTYIDDGWIKMSFFMGYALQNSTNELKNVVYHLENGLDVGDQPQEDNGSRLDLKLSGCRFGLSDEVRITENCLVNLGLVFSVWDATAHGLWNNHDPAWNWVDHGYTIGYQADLGLQYFLTSSLSLGAGYFYNFAQADDGTERINGSYIDQAVDLRYKMQGYHIGFNYRF